MDIIKEAAYGKINGAPGTLTTEAIISAFGETARPGLRSLFEEGRIDTIDGVTWVPVNPQKPIGGNNDKR